MSVLNSASRALDIDSARKSLLAVRDKKAVGEADGVKKWMVIDFLP